MPTLDFAFKFFRQSLAKTPDNNILTAPIALSRDFALLQNGADAEAREEILRAFELGNLSSEEINQQSLALHTALSYPQPHPPHLRRAILQTRRLRHHRCVAHLHQNALFWRDPCGRNRMSHSDLRSWSGARSSIPSRLYQYLAEGPPPRAPSTRGFRDRLAVR